MSGDFADITCQSCELHRREGSEYIRDDETLSMLGSYASFYLREIRM